MKRILFLLFLTFLTVFTSFRGNSQQASDSSSVRKDCSQKDIFDVVFPKNDFPKPIVVERKLRILAIPTISYAPVTGLQLGAGATLSWNWGRELSTRLSAGMIQAVWTTERQFIVQAKNCLLYTSPSPRD